MRRHKSWRQICEERQEEERQRQEAFAAETGAHLESGYPMVMYRWYDIPGTGLEAYADLTTPAFQVWVREKR